MNVSLLYTYNKSQFSSQCACHDCHFFAKESTFAANSFAKNRWN